ncbi:MAG: aminotransferase class I/II-fold pyridoxal phosphate-dependent enzyme [Pirellulales bacterium]|nr:aminotransferase class I/II-fold pyridoxal phosphate-dependent enzyme [Pirellulales bacterium]
MAIKQVTKPENSSTSPAEKSLARGNPKLGASTLAVHAGEDRQKAAHSITDPIYVASTYTFADTQSVIDYIEQKQTREEYGRYGNPSERVVERKLAALEGGESALLFSTGMSALVVLLIAKLNAGDEVVFFDECYHRSREFCGKHLSRFGVVTRQVRACDYGAMEAAITENTKFLISESPTNPHLSIVDLERFADLGRRKHVETIIDATLGTPYNIRPLAAGVDYVLHSATKYLGGHNDLLAGALVGTAEKLEPVRKLRGITGAINSPHNIYLLERGLKTFELRMQRHNENGLAIAEFLADHPRIERVYYPGLPSHPYYEVAQRTMRGFGGLVTFQVRDADWRATADIVDRVRIPRIAPSLGGVESLIEQPLVMSYYECTPEDRRRFGIYDNMIRMACGIENTNDLIDDLQQALAQ